MIVLGLFIGIGVILLIIAAVLAVGIWGGSSASTMSTGAYIWDIGNTDQQLVTSAPLAYPYTKTSSEVSVGLAVLIPGVVPADPSLPILVSLPVAGNSLGGAVLYSSHSLPVGQTSLRPVLYNPIHVAFQYVPSGNLATGAELTTSWMLIFQVIYNIA